MARTVAVQECVHLVLVLHCFALGSAAGNWSMCPGAVDVDGYGRVAMTNAGLNTQQAGDEAANSDVRRGHIIPMMNSRTYFSDECVDGVYNNSRYTALKLLGKKLTYTVDVSGAGCGCNAAMYLTSLHQNPKISDCQDYYCDANSVCGVACAEIDIMEANERAWHSTLHAWDDGMGMASVGGYGGNQARDWNAQQYGPGGHCIDTSKPFEVASSFPMNADGVLDAMEIELTQHGHSCPLSISIAGYKLKGRDGMADMTKALMDGMTPIISYWKSDKMLWLDGLGEDFKGPCAQDDPSACAESVRFSDFSVKPICTERCPVGHCNKDDDGMCIWFTAAGAESYHCQIANCSEAPEESPAVSNCWSWQGVHFYSLKKRDVLCQDEWHKQQREREQVVTVPAVKERENDHSLVPVIAIGALVSAAVVIALLVFLTMPKRRHPASAGGASHGSQVTPETPMPRPSSAGASRPQGNLRMVSSREILLIEPDDAI